MALDDTPGSGTRPRGLRGEAVTRAGQVLALALGVVMLAFLGLDPGPAPEEEQPPQPARLSGAQAGQCLTDDCRIMRIVDNVQAYWTRDFDEPGDQSYRPAQPVLFTETIDTPCGRTTSTGGPFYCPANRRVYLYRPFFEALQRDHGVRGGPLAEAYIVAHEFGHHVQGQLGMPQGDSLRMELQADCFAGTWAKNAVQSGFYVEPFSSNDIRQAFQAAKAVGAAMFGRPSGPPRDPDWFVRGAFDQRVKWFTLGYQSGDPMRCDTFSGDI
ncbi:neutral zinc metallopeptidase [Streptosporangium soli]|nr:neutral zinc metallopeptidase [Streptosporangium sp. KLBMP 9127]